MYRHTVGVGHKEKEIITENIKKGVPEKGKNQSWVIKIELHPWALKQHRVYKKKTLGSVVRDSSSLVSQQGPLKYLSEIRMIYNVFLM